MRSRLVVLAWLMLGGTGCLVEEVCTPADSTYSCCLKQRLNNPGACSGIEVEGTPVSPGRATGVAIGTVTAAATLSSDGEIFSEKTRAAVEEILRECAAFAHEAVNRRYFTGEPTRARCAEVLSLDPRGNPITLAMQLGIEKHAAALACSRARLDKLLPGRFSVEQRYRHDPATGKLEVISPEEYELLRSKNQGRGLIGTLQPDLIIHSGDPLKVQAVFDFKFPCLRETQPRWTVYENYPYRDQTQGQVYQKVFGSANRVTPWEFLR